MFGKVTFSWFQRHLSAWLRHTLTPPHVDMYCTVTSVLRQIFLSFFSLFFSVNGFYFPFTLFHITY
jgi:hypothetical protein